MSEIITKEQIPEYEAFLQSHPKGHFAQSVLWAKQKPMWKWEAIVSRDQNGKIKGSLAVLIRKIVPGGRALYHDVWLPCARVTDFG